MSSLAVWGMSYGIRIYALWHEGQPLPATPPTQEYLSRDFHRRSQQRLKDLEQWWGECANNNHTFYLGIIHISCFDVALTGNKMKIFCTAGCFWMYLFWDLAVIKVTMFDTAGCFRMYLLGTRKILFHVALAVIKVTSWRLCCYCRMLQDVGTYFGGRNFFGAGVATASY